RSRCGSDCCFFSGVGGVGSGGGVVLSIEACTSVLATLAAGSSGGLGAPSCSATGFAGCAFGALREPAVSSVNSLTEMIPTGIGAVSLWSGLAAKVNAPQPSTMTCTAIDAPKVQVSRLLVDAPPIGMVRPALIAPRRALTCPAQPPSRARPDGTPRPTAAP